MLITSNSLSELRNSHLGPKSFHTGNVASNTGNSTSDAETPPPKSEPGYQFRIDGPNVIVQVAEFISLEKLCCPFLNFEIEVEAENGPVWIKLTGREGVKEFIREEISGLLGTAVDWSRT